MKDIKLLESATELVNLLDPSPRQDDDPMPKLNNTPIIVDWEKGTVKIDQSKGFAVDENITPKTLMVALAGALGIEIIYPKSVE